MMKKLASLTLALVVAASTAAVAAEHIVGGTPNNANTFPFFGSHPGHRWQTIWFQTEINETGPISKIEWQMRTAGGGVGGTYNNCDILLCHTRLSVVTATFADNYGGNTPVNVYTGTYVLPSSSGDQWVTIVEPKNFTYSNKDNLLIEISWQGSAPATNYFKCRSTGSAFPGRVYNSSSKTATTGTLDTAYHHYGRITVGYVGVAPTSLGRVKGLYN
jgi:hypothetical protein